MHSHPLQLIPLGMRSINEEEEEEEEEEEMISTQFLWGSVLLRRELQKYVTKKSNFDNFERSLYSAGSMPLRGLNDFGQQLVNTRHLKHPSGWSCFPSPFVSPFECPVHNNNIIGLLPIHNFPLKFVMVWSNGDSFGL